VKKERQIREEAREKRNERKTKKGGPVEEEEK